MREKMLQELKNKSLKQKLPVIIILLVIGLGLFVYHIPGVITMIKGPVPFEELEFDEIKDQYVTVNYNLNWGTFAEETTTTTRNGVKVSEGVSARMDVILVGGIEKYFEEDTYFQFIGISIPKKYFNQAKVVDRNTEEFFKLLQEYYYDYSISDQDLLDLVKDNYQWTGQICPLDDEMMGYYKDFFEYDGYTDEDIKAYCAPYYIKLNAVKQGMCSTVIVFTILGFILTVIGLFMLIKALRGGYQKNLVKQLNKNSATQISKVETDYQCATEFCKNVKMGRSFLFSMVSATTEVIPLDKMLWVYIHQTNNKTYFVTVSKDYSLYINMDDGKRYIIPARNEEEAMALIEKLHNARPGIIVGYTDELNKVYHSNINEMIQYRNENNSGFDNSGLDTTQE